MSHWQSTSNRVLRAAEELFASEGFHAVSLRMITKRAGANLAAVNYHHVDKESLLIDLLTARLRTLSQRRFAALEAKPSRSSLGPELDDVLEAFARPLLCPDTAHPDFSSSSRRLIGRVLIEPLPWVEPVISAELRPSLTRFGQILRSFCPRLSPSDFVWQYSQVVGALHHCAAALDLMTERTSGFCRDGDGESALRAFVRLGRSVFTMSELA